MTAREHAERASRALAKCEELSAAFEAADEGRRLEALARDLPAKSKALREVALAHALTSVALLAVDGLVLSAGGESGER